jgi:hypothetical protein
MAGQRRVGPPGGYWPARRGLQSRRDPAARSPDGAGDRGGHRTAASQDLAWRAGGGLVRGTVNGMVEPLDGGRRSRVTIALEFEGHRIGRLLVPLVVRRQARRQLPKNEQKLKEVLER